MIDRYRVTTLPAVEPYTLTELKDHLRITDTDLADLTAKAAAARSYTERLLGRAFVTQTLTLTLDRFPTGTVIPLPRAPLQSVTSVTYTTLAGVPTVLAEDYYRVDTASEPGRIVLRDSLSWPSDSLLETGGVVIVYKAGYGVLLSGSTPTAGRPATMPPELVLAIFQLTGHWHESREAYTDQASGNLQEVPLAYQRLVAEHRLGVF